MSTVEDFENAPVGARATHEATGSRAMKMDEIDRYWMTQNGFYLADEEMEQRGYTLDPLDSPAPATAREALDLAWDLAHEVKPGQLVPRNTRYLEVHNSELRVRTAQVDFKIIPAYVTTIRTLEPLPDPGPDWLDAHAVLAECLSCNEDGLVKSVHVNFIGERWACTECQRTLPWRDLTDVTPLWPK